MVENHLYSIVKQDMKARKVFEKNDMQRTIMDVAYI